jgi:hypothetical protein
VQRVPAIETHQLTCLLFRYCKRLSQCSSENVVGVSRRDGRRPGLDARGLRHPTAMTWTLGSTAVGDLEYQYEGDEVSMGTKARSGDIHLFS